MRSPLPIEDWLILTTLTSWQLVSTIHSVTALATILYIFGLLSGSLQESFSNDLLQFRDDGWIDFTTVVCVWLY